MKKLLALLSLLVTTSPWARGVEYEIWTYTQRDLFPSALISTATVDWNGDEETAEDRKTEDDEELGEDDVPIFGDENGWVGVSLYEVPAGARVKVEIAIDGFLLPSTWEGTIDDAHEEAHVFPKGAWDYAALHKVREQRPVNVSARVSVNGKALPARTETCTLRSLNDCPYYVVWDEEEGDFEDYSWIFAAYVNENHPWIDGILKEALQSGLVSSFTGYQSGDPEEVMAQVFAVWNVLQRRGIKYSDISTTASPNKGVYSQTVRFLEDTIDATQANCVDGSALMASVLRKIGLNVHLVMVPGHCFLAFDSSDDEENAEMIGLETTLLGEDALKPVADLANLPEKTKKKEFTASFKTFSHAVKAGNESLEEHAEAFDSGEDPDAQIISIAEVRELGIMPIASGRERK